MYSPQAGTFTWKKGYPSILTSFWGGQSSLIMQGAIRAFQSNHGLTMTGVMTPSLWRAWSRPPRWQGQPQRLHLRAGQQGEPGNADRVAQRACRHAHAGQHRHPGRADRGRHLPGLPALRVPDHEGAPTRTGRTTPTRSPGWPTSTVATRCTTSRAASGAPQSLGCVELPYAQAHYVWPYLTYGSLVTVRLTGWVRGTTGAAWADWSHLLVQLLDDLLPLGCGHIARPPILTQVLPNMAPKLASGARPYRARVSRGSGPEYASSPMLQMGLAGDRPSSAR